MRYVAAELTSEEIEDIFDSREVFSVVPGQPTMSREGNPRIVAFLGKDGKHLELLIPQECYDSKYVYHGERLPPMTYGILRFSIGCGTLVLGKAPIVLVGEDGFGRMYVVLPMDPDAGPFIHVCKPEAK